MNAYYLQTEQMTVGYHGKPLIEKINLCLRRGEIMTLIGPNGSGKSTILKSIVRQLRLLGGVVRLEQVSLEELSPQAVARKMSVLMTDRLQPELMTCREVAAAGRYPYTGKLGLLTQRDWEKVDEALALVHGSALADQAFTAISDGQRQRVLLARALCQEPEILVLDEPTSFLDIRYKLEILSTLRNWFVSVSWRWSYPFTNWIWPNVFPTLWCVSTTMPLSGVGRRKRCLLLITLLHCMS